MNSSGEIIGADTSELYALGSGCTSCTVDYYNGVTGVSKYKYTLSVKEDENYKSVIKDIAVDVSQQPDKAIVTCTNNGDSAAEFVEVIALFFKDDILIRNNTTYVVDDDSELKAGATLSTQLDCYEQYDEVKVFLTGRSHK